MDKSEYVELAVERVRAVLADHHAVVHSELESRIAEANWAGSAGNVDPHHITTALQQLKRDEEIVWEEGRATRGRRQIATIQPVDRRRRATKIDRSAARKRLLYSRYQGWAQGTKRYPQGLIGPAGETAVRLAVIESGALQPAVPGAGEASTLLGVQLSGPVDSAGFMVPLKNGLPMSPVTVLIEVKNIRGWIYPNSVELYQLLGKASRLQNSRPDQLILPILVCRKTHPTTYWMAKQLGFFAIETGRQFAGDVDGDALLEVRNELHFNDLFKGADPSVRVRDRLSKTIPKYASAAAEQWRETSAELEATFSSLGRKRLSNSTRRIMTNRLREQSAELGHPGGW